MSWRDALQRRDEVKAAYLEGFGDAAGPLPAAEAWKQSKARGKLAQPFHEGARG